MKFDNGVLVANLLAFDADLAVDWHSLQRHTHQLKDIPGVRGFVVNAYAGEGPTLTQAERDRAVALHRDVANPDQPVVACILSTSTAGAIEQARSACDHGANALLICPPIVSGWNATASPHIALEFHRAIAAAVDLPIILFQLSIGDPVAYSHDLLIQMVREIDSVVGVKMAQANDAVRYDQDYLALQQIGRPIFALPSVGSSMFHGLNTGADGILTGLATFAPHEITELWQSTARGDFARAKEIHLQLAELNQLIYGSPYVDLHNRYKEVAYLAGAIPTPHVRGPQVRVSESEQARLAKALQRANLKPLA
jgi:4-hydroxy-tetrahydrodipicolinate synthase